MSTPSVRVAAVAPPAPVEDEPIYHTPDDQRPRLSFPAKNLPHISMASLRQLREDQREDLRQLREESAGRGHRCGWAHLCGRATVGDGGDDVE